MSHNYSKPKEQVAMQSTHKGQSSFTDTQPMFLKLKTTLTQM